MQMATLTEFEESVSFDLDDPDFPPQVALKTAHGVFHGMKFAAEIALNVNKCARGNNMSATTFQTTTENLSRHGSNISLSCHSTCGSIEESLGSHPQYQDTIMTIEELRAQLNSCFSCGVSWSEEHVSLDCSECGGYSLQRPCPLCDGRCHTVWKRDITMSHASGKARWIGECGLSCGPALEESLVPALEKLRATS
ncbi:protein pinocchio [Copidosoma floridanum]|uniref:protein pinocchio n=1 Tax=Copidosoma floridanum TaxID=29053 RepID=UPI0006C9462C|nr:protein pinocchio [Copidosoma floridanum]XP_014210687.1 protein pinocchio [Copidosoma floridanum]